MKKKYIAEFELIDSKGKARCSLCPCKWRTKDEDGWVKWGCVLTGKEIYIGGMDMGPCPSRWCPLIEKK